MFNQFLRKVPLFADMPDPDMERLCRMIQEVDLPAGQTLFAEGDAGERAYVIEEGQIEILKSSSGREVLLAVRGVGDVIGEAALLEDAPRMAGARARTHSKLLAIHKTQLDELVQQSASAARAMFFTVLARWRATGVMLRQSEKMAQLGTLTAGVAHELNNPAAAVKRGVSQLADAIAQLVEAEKAMACLSFSPAEQGRLAELGARARERAGRPSDLDALERSDREQEIETWLEDNGVADGWSLAPTLTSLAQDTAGLGALAAEIGAPRLPAVLRWLGGTYAVANLGAEISHGAGRISEIVKALKSYSYLDQAPVQEVDVHEGIDNTLVILRSKLKAGIDVRREYATDLPRIQAWGSEINQVWTNILDNAADALGGKGTITIRTRREGDWIVVAIQDTGPGIPPEIVGRIFDPFFTTKPPGKGTGLGLDISYRIVVHKHRGDIRVTSQPGDTRFEVRLPIAAGDAKAAPTAVAAIARASDDDLRRILEKTRTIAVVGLSGRPDRPSHEIPKELQARGYRIIPVNPTLAEALGEKAYPDLPSIPDPVDTVLVFRASDEVPPIVEQAIRIGARVVWMQEGIVNEQAAARARAAGLDVVMDACMRATSRRLDARPASGST